MRPAPQHGCAPVPQLHTAIWQPSHCWHEPSAPGCTAPGLEVCACLDGGRGKQAVMGWPWLTKAVCRAWARGSLCLIMRSRKSWTPVLIHGWAHACQVQDRQPIISGPSFAKPPASHKTFSGTADNAFAELLITARLPALSPLAMDSTARSTRALESQAPLIQGAWSGRVPHPHQRLKNGRTGGKDVILYASCIGCSHAHHLQAAAVTRPSIH